MAASAFIEYRDRNEDEEMTVDGPYLLNRDVFQFSYRETDQEIRRRFDPWLNEVLLLGLDQWRRQL
jgi:hypothetical protein